jgi:hypothetical protein
MEVMTGKPLSDKSASDPGAIWESENFSWWPLAELNCGHKDFQSSALPTELKGHQRDKI